MTPPPPQPAIMVAVKRTVRISIAGTKRRWRPGLKSIRASSSNENDVETSARSQKINFGGVRRLGFVDGGSMPRAVVEMVSVLDVAVEPGVKLLGLKLALDADGRPEAEKMTAFAKPPAPGVIVIVKFADCPAVTVTGATGPPVEKSMPVPLSVIC